MDSAGLWSEIASGLMPDSWFNLKRIRELMLEKNRLFEDQEPGALEAMIEINKQVDELMESAIEDLNSEPVFLADVQQSIAKCHEIEKMAFQRLNSIVGDGSS